MNNVCYFTIFITGWFLSYEAVHLEFHYLHLFNNNTDLDLTYKIKQLSPTQIGAYVDFNVKRDMYDDYRIIYNFHRKMFGGNQYTKFPFGTLAQSDLSTFMNVLYKPIQSGFKNCSNVPQIKGKWEPPLKAILYKFRACPIKDEDVPKFMPAGEYKIVFDLTRKRGGMSRLIGFFKITR